MDSPDCALLLLEAGANPNVEDMYGITPLGTACSTVGSRCIDMLIEHGAKINLTCDIDLTTPLHSCFFRGNVDCLRALLRHKPDTSIKQKHGYLAIDSSFRDDMS